MTRAEKRLGRSIAESFSAVTVWGLAYIVVGVSLANAAAWPLYSSPRALLVGFVGGIAGLLAGLIPRLLKWGRVLTAAVALGVYLVIAVPLAVPSALESAPAFASGLRDAVFGIVLGWRQILTLSPPLGEYQAVLVPFLLVTYFGAFFATVLVLDKRRRATMAVVVVTGMSLFGIAFGVAGTSPSIDLFGAVLPAPREWTIGIAVFGASLVWLVGLSRLRRARALRTVAAQNVTRRTAPLWLGVRRHMLTGALVAVAFIVGIAVVPAASGWTERSVLRDEVEPRIVVQRQPSPLSAYRSWFAGDRLDETVITVEGDAKNLQRIRFATLDYYDGENFHIAQDERFSRLPRAAAPGDGRIALRISVGEGYRGVWIPTPANLAQAPVFSGARRDDLADGFHVDSGGDTAITIAEASDGAVGLRPGDQFDVLAEAPRKTAGLSGTRAGEPSLDPSEYPALVEWAEMQELPRTGAGYLELVERLRARGYLSHSLLEDPAASGWIAALGRAERYEFTPSYAGHSAARIEELFSSLIEQQRDAGADATPAMLVSAVGDDEQFSVAAALLARLWGLESRVVLGVRLAAADEVPGIPACETICTGSNMSAWVEVRAKGGEWSAVDTTPQFALVPRTITEGEQLPEHATVPDQPRSESVDPPTAQNDSQDEEASTDVLDSGILETLVQIARTLGMTVLALLLFALPLIVVIVAKRVRRRMRRNDADPELRLVGAWEELTDLYTDYGVSVSQTGTRVQNARMIDRAAAGQLALAVDRGVFAGQSPTDADAAEAWEIVDRERGDLASESGRWARLFAELRLRSFVSRVRRGRTAAYSARRLGVGTLAMVGFRRREEEA